jgi:hypothetical protein
LWFSESHWYLKLISYGLKNLLSCCTVFQKLAI